MAIKSTASQGLPTNSQAEKYALLYPLLKYYLSFREIKELSKKKQDDPLNKLKVGKVNKILSQIKTDVLNDDPSRVFLDLLDDKILPTNSDAVLIIAQYEAAMAQFHAKHYGWDGTKERWFTKENPGF